MPWVRTTDVDRFLVEAGHFLESDVVANNALLTEARFWSALPVRQDGALFGWWVEDHEVEAAFVGLPDHPVICSPLSQAAAAGLADAVPAADWLGIDASEVEAVIAAFATRGTMLRAGSGMTLLQLRAPVRTRPYPDGHPRPADRRDLPLLRTWFAAFQQRHPEDRRRVAFVIDQPVEDGGVVLWESHGQPVAMASRTPQVADMVRMGLAFQPSNGNTYATAAFDAACADAERTAETVLSLSGTDDDTATCTSLGFTPLLERVVLRHLHSGVVQLGSRGCPPPVDRGDLP